MPGIRAPARIPTGIEKVDLALEQHRRSIDDLREGLFANYSFSESVSLADATTVRVRHKLNRPYVSAMWMHLKGPASTGRIEFLTPTDSSKEVWVQANGWGATITVDVLVF